MRVFRRTCGYFWVQSQCRLVEGVNTPHGGLEAIVLSSSPQQSFPSSLFCGEDAVASVILGVLHCCSASLTTGSPHNHVQGDWNISNVSPVVVWRPRAKTSQRKDSLNASPVLGIIADLFAKPHAHLPS